MERGNTSTRSKKLKKIVVLGGGITGLSAAFYIKKYAKQYDLPIELKIIEHGDRLGGKVNTLRKDGFIIEKGPDSFLARKTPILTLSHELGITNRLVGLNMQSQGTFILHKDKFYRMPAGFVYGIPTQMKPFLQTGLISPVGKARAALDLMLPTRKEKSDESVGAFLTRRLGTEVMSHIVEPLLAGIYAGDMSVLSLQATFPQFQQMEQDQGSLIRGMILNRKQPKPLSEYIPDHLKKSMFLSFDQGLSTIIESMEAQFIRQELLLNQTVVSLNRVEQRYELILSDGQVIEADSVISALPAFESSRLLERIPGLGGLQRIPYVSVANVVLAFRKTDFGAGLNGSGFLVPRKENRFITACTLTSSKWSHTAPDDYVLLRCYVGRAGDEGWMRFDDEKLIRHVRKELFELLNVRVEPLFTEVTRLKQSMPQYLVGHLDRLEQTKRSLQRYMPGLYIAGAGYEGVGLPDCIEQGKTVAMESLDFIRSPGG